jgi:two-component system phosphate regulon sensor histidine kinase PhoR
MKKEKLFIKIFKRYFILTLLAIILLTLFASTTTRNYFYSQISHDLEVRGKLIAHQIANNYPLLPKNRINILANELGNKLNMRITILLPNGEVIGDSEKKPSSMDNHLNRPEIKAIFNNHIPISERYSKTVNKNLMYVAVPVLKENQIIAIVRISLPLEFINTIIMHIILNMLIIGVIILIVLTLISLYFSRQLSKPLEVLENRAMHFVNNDIFSPLPEFNIIEIDKVAREMNEMVNQINYKIETIEQQNKEQEAVFSSMNEGIIAVAADKTIIKINRAASEMFKINLASVYGLKIEEIVKIPDLDAFINKALTTNAQATGAVVLKYEDEKYLQVNVSILEEKTSGNNGAIIVFNDITHLKKLENIRKEFVANVSHELKTPVTTIKGFVETLKDGAIDNRIEAEQFLNIISKHVTRLEQIIEDLLALSRIDQEYENSLIQMKNENLQEIINAVLADCELKAQAKKIEIKTSIASNHYANINFSLIEQALVNLLDNAIKYSGENSNIFIECLYNSSKTIISVKDEGCGISEEHLSRLFERFYRVDKARSRKLGGTGLGLAIVKHIIQAHNGYITVDSIPDEGSTFTIHLPQ